MKKILIFIVVFCLFLTGFSRNDKGYDVLLAQRDNNYSSFALLTWENDFYLRTDYYFTNGAALQLTGNQYAITAINRFLYTPLTLSDKTYSINIRQNMYTPEKMYADNLQVEDRPYAGYFTTEYKVISENATRRFSASLTLGILGKYSLAGAAQNLVHSMDHLEQPTGWNYQMTDAPIINLNYTHEHKILNTHLLDAHYTIAGRLGSLYTDASVSTGFRIGKQNSAFGFVHLNNRPGSFEFYFFGEAGARVSYYDATLQGSILIYNPSKHYFTNQQRHMVISKFTGGIVLGYDRFKVRTSLTTISPEYVGGKTHGWGEITLGVAF